MNPLLLTSIKVIISFYFGVLIGVIIMCVFLVNKRKEEKEETPVIDITRIASDGIMDECMN